MPLKIFDPAPVQNFATQVTRILSEWIQTIAAIEEHAQNVWDLPPRHLRNQFRIVRIYLGQTGEVFNEVIHHSIFTGNNIRKYRPGGIPFDDGSGEVLNSHRRGIQSTACLCYVLASTIVEFVGRCASSFGTLRTILEEETGDKRWSATAFDPRHEWRPICSAFESFWSTIIDFCDGGYPEAESGPNMAELILWEDTIGTLQDLKSKVDDFGFSYFLEDMVIAKLQPIPVLRDETAPTVEKREDFLVPQCLGDDIVDVLPKMVEILHFTTFSLKHLYDAVMERWKIPPLEVQDIIFDLRQWLHILWSDLAAHLNVVAEVAKRSLLAIEDWNHAAASRAQSQLEVLRGEADQVIDQFRLLSSSWQFLWPVLSKSFELLPEPLVPDEPETDIKCCFPRTQPSHRPATDLQPTRNSFCPRLSLVPSSIVLERIPTSRVLYHITQSLDVASSSTLHLVSFYKKQSWGSAAKPGHSIPYELRQVAMEILPLFEKTAQMITEELIKLDADQFPMPSHGAVKVVPIVSESKYCLIS